MSGHTPGPWRVGFNAGFSDDGELIAGAWIEAGEFRSLATLIPVREVKANANLMAAAPDLLAACKRALDEMVHTNAPRNSFTDAVDLLDAAIARADGRS